MGPSARLLGMAVHRGGQKGKQKREARSEKHAKEEKRWMKIGWRRKKGLRGTYLGPNEIAYGRKGEKKS